MEARGSRQCLQEPNASLCPEPVESSNIPTTCLFKIQIPIYT
jgi:hypothetical protein